MANGFLTASPSARHATAVAITGGGYVRPQKFICGGSGPQEISEIGIWGDSTSAANTARLHLGIFTHDAVNNCPESLVTNSDSGELTVNSASVIKTSYTYSVKPQLTGGVTYWLAHICYDNDFRRDRATVGGDSLGISGLTYPNWPSGSDWHTHTDSTNDIGIYAVYSANVGSYAGVLSIAGSIKRLLSKLTRVKAGVVPLTGLLTYIYLRIVKAGTLGFSGIVTNSAGRVRILSFVGTILRFMVSSWIRAGVLSVTGSLTRQVGRLGRTYSGVVSFAGNALGYLTSSDLFYATKAGAISFAGSIIDVLVMTPHIYTKSRAISFVGTLRKKRILGRTKAGTLSFVKFLTYAIEGFVTVNYYRTYAGAVGFAGSVLKAFHPSTLNSLTLVGAIKKAVLVSRAKLGAISFTGTIYGWKTGTPGMLLGYPKGVISAAGSLIRGFLITRVFSGVLRFTGGFTRLLEAGRTKSSSLGFRGRAYGDRITDALYYGSVYNRPNY